MRQALFFGLLTNLPGAVFIEQGLFFCPKTSIILEKYEKFYSTLLAYTCALWGFFSYLSMAV